MEYEGLQVEIDEQRKVLLVYCRETDKGALTYIESHSRGINAYCCVKKVMISRTGKHWVEEIPVQGGDIVKVFDRINSGKERIVEIPILDD